MAKSLPSNAGDTGLVAGEETKIPHVVGQLSHEPHCVANTWQTK